MLLEFTVGNFLSFKDKKTFSLEAGSISEHNDNVVKEGKYKVLRSAVIYGANSSGKSNFIKALEFMVATVKNSSKLNSITTPIQLPMLRDSADVNDFCSLTTAAIVLRLIELTTIGLTSSSNSKK